MRLKIRKYQLTWHENDRTFIVDMRLRIEPMHKEHRKEGERARAEKTVKI